MSFKQFIVIPVFIAFQAFTMMVLAPFIRLPGVDAGGPGLITWIAFQAWAMYFLAGCDLKGGIKTLIGYIVGIVASIAIMVLGGKLAGMGFYAVPLAILVIVIPVIFLEKVKWLDFIPAIFVGAGAFFAFMSYVPNATFAIAAKTEIIYCLLGLFYGYITIAIRGAYEKKVGAASE